MLFFVGTSPRDAYMLPDGCNIMLNARQFWNGKRLAGSGGFATRLGHVFLDCGGYVFFQEYGDFPFPIREYVRFVTSLNPSYFATMDYPCEPSISTSLADWNVTERMARTVENAVKILNYFPAGVGPVPVPVVQGWSAADYIQCLDWHAQAGTVRPYMALGSMCTRSRTADIANLIREVGDYAKGLGVHRLHAFGLKRSPHLERVADVIYSRDSAAVYFAPNDRVKAEWGGKMFAPSRQAKRQAVAMWLDNLSAAGLVWSCEL